MSSRSPFFSYHLFVFGIIREFIHHFSVKNMDVHHKKGTFVLPGIAKWFKSETGGVVENPSIEGGRFRL